MAIKITTPNNGEDALTFGSATTLVAAEVTGSEVSSGEGKLELKTTTGGTSATKVTIAADGKVGIGVTNPDLKMEIVDTSSGASKDALLLTNYGAASNTETGIFFSPTEADGAIRGARISALNDGAADSNSVALKFSTGLGAPPVERMRVTSAGNVGINRTAPVTKLHIEGGGTSLPATTGTTPSAGTTLRIRPGNNAVLDIGGNSTSGAWLQSYDQTGMQTEYPLLLNPNGGAVTLGTPLAVTSGGTGNTQGGKLVRNHYINSTGAAQDVANTTTMTSVGCSASIAVTAGNILTVWWTAGIYGNGARHYSGTAFLNGTAMGSANWGDGIHSGAVALSGWITTDGSCRTVIPTTGTFTLEFKLNCLAGTAQVRRDGNVGYDGVNMIVQETTP